MKEIQELLNIKMETLLKEEYGPLSFKSEESKILFIIKILEFLNKVNSDLIQSKQFVIRSFIEKVKDLFYELQNYNGIDRNTLIQSIQSVADGIPTDIYSIISVNFSINGAKYIDDTIKDKTKAIDTTIDKINIRAAESEHILKKMKENMATTGIADYADIFRKESSIHKKDSENWLAGTIFIVGVVIIIALLLLVGGLSPKDKETATLVQFTFSKIIIFSSLFFLLTLAFKSYKASKHNEILNKHRQNAITTFEKFVKSANDDKTKNAVLLQTVNAIFSQQSTGYNDNDNDSGTPQTKFLEIINSSVKSDSK